MDVEPLSEINFGIKVVLSVEVCVVNLKQTTRGSREGIGLESYRNRQPLSDQLRTLPASASDQATPSIDGFCDCSLDAIFLVWKSVFDWLWQGSVQGIGHDVRGVIQLITVVGV